MIKTKEEIEIISEGGKILAKVLKQVSKLVKPGVTTNELNRAAEALILSYGGLPAFKGYNGFPTALCTSVNEVIVHGIPSERVLKQGDIISLDLGVLYKGYNTDMAVSLPVGKISKEAKELINTVKKTLDICLKKIRAGMTTRELGGIIETYIESRGFGVVRELCGHGIGKEVHEDPQIPNYKDERALDVLKEGMVICIEPMATMSAWRIRRARDNYGFQTKDSSLAAHFEVTLVVTKTGNKVLTR